MQSRLLACVGSEEGFQGCIVHLEFSGFDELLFQVLAEDLIRQRAFLREELLAYLIGLCSETGFIRGRMREHVDHDVVALNGEDAAGLARLESKRLGHALTGAEVWNVILARKILALLKIVAIGARKLCKIALLGLLGESLSFLMCQNLGLRCAVILFDHG